MRLENLKTHLCAGTLLLAVKVKFKEPKDASKHGCLSAPDDRSVSGFAKDLTCSAECLSDCSVAEA